MDEPTDTFYLDDEPLRKAILKGYFGDRVAPLEPEPLMAHLRDLLSGPPPGECEEEDYYFELDPEFSIPAFFRGLEEERPGLSSLLFEPLFSAVDDEHRESNVSNWTVLVSSLAGSVAVKAKISEALGGALLGGLLIAIARLGPRKVRRLYEETFKPPPANLE